MNSIQEINRIIGEQIAQENEEEAHLKKHLEAVEHILLERHTLPDCFEILGCYVAQQEQLRYLTDEAHLRKGWHYQVQLLLASWRWGEVVLVPTVDKYMTEFYSFFWILYPTPEQASSLKRELEIFGKVTPDESPLLPGALIFEFDAGWA